MYNEVIISKLLTCLEHIEAVEEYVKDINTADEFAKRIQRLNL